MLLLIAITVPVHGEEKTTHAPATSTTGAVGDAHHRLAELAGLWRVKQSLWLAPGQPPQIDSGTALLTVVLGGRHLQQDLRIDSSTPFQGLGYTGYDSTSGRYYSSWIDTNFTGVLLLRGDYDAGTTTYRFDGDMSGERGEVIPTREELHLLGQNHWVSRYYETRHGKEALVVELEYSRP
ncbi:hypothetical protein GCM10027159_24090 [Lysobacter terrae]